MTPAVTILPSLGWRGQGGGKGRFGDFGWTQKGGGCAAFSECVSGDKEGL